ncbi:methylenetetrahydrofolate reductase [Actinotalea sp. K2]|uniref:methylenetetrahydrofolate reductase n=1 Tax=Actinotalea sp. K2 TaxID=2939438 RepID=UPI002016CCAB|nr:methylenetetrahydrofolate reductase [Actinotalea sp. K2]MCL3862888.1 methylenetetrahydrofolate reductase [Actinotalea sp. K2]
MSDATARPRTGVAGRLTRAAGPTSLSFELFPAATAAGDTRLRATVEQLASLRPDFFSVTYGAAGAATGASRSLTAWLARGTVPVVAHVTFAGMTAAQVREVAADLLADGVRDFLALRGDLPPGVTPPDGRRGDGRPADGELGRASDLVALLRDLAAATGCEVGVGVAAAPAALDHLPTDVPPTRCGDLQALLGKQAAGADYAITQVVFDPASYARYVRVARRAGVTLPLVPGIVPLTDPGRLRRLQQISGVDVPPHVLDLLDAETDAQRRAAAGTALGAELARALLDAGAPGLHVFTFDQYEPTAALLHAAGLRPAP